MYILLHYYPVSPNTAAFHRTWVYYFHVKHCSFCRWILWLCFSTMMELLMNGRSSNGVIAWYMYRQLIKLSGRLNWLYFIHSLFYVWLQRWLTRWDYLNITSTKFIVPFLICYLILPLLYDHSFIFIGYLKRETILYQLSHGFIHAT